MNAAALEFYDLIIFMRGPGAQRKKITALFGGMKAWAAFAAKKENKISETLLGQYLLSLGS